MTDKVYCSECKWYWVIIGACDLPANRKDNWFAKDRAYISSPKDKNKDNNCPDFIQKENQKEKRRKLPFSYKFTWP